MISNLLYAAAAVLFVLALVTWLGFHIVAAGAVALLVAAIICLIVAYFLPAGHRGYRRY